MEKWKGKVALVTGASSGIGAAIAEELVKSGLLVVGIARRKEFIDTLTTQLANLSGKLYPLKVDITNESEILQAFAWIKANLGFVSILVNCAGVLPFNMLIDGDLKKWRETWDTNVIGLCIATREAIKDMNDNNVNGHIIHINGLSGHVIPNIMGFSMTYGTKFAVKALTETLKQELNSWNSKIKITSISPGLVDTDMAKDLKVLGKRGLTTNFPKLKPKDVADAVVYVISTPPHVQVGTKVVATGCSIGKE